MKKRRMLTTLLTAAVSVSLLAGCGGKNGTETQTPAPGNTNNQTTSKDEQVNLRFVSWLTAYQDLDKKVADAYTAEHPNVTITFDYYGDMTATEYYKKVDLMVMGGEEMDVLMTSAFPEHAQSWFWCLPATGRVF